MGRVGSVGQKKLLGKESRRQQCEGQASAHSNVQGQGPPGICKSPSLTELIMCPVFLSFPIRSGHQQLSRRAILKVNWMAAAEPPGPGRHLDCLLFRCPVLWQLQRRGWIRRTPSRRQSTPSNPGGIHWLGNGIPWIPRFKHKHKWMRRLWPKWVQGASFI